MARAGRMRTASPSLPPSLCPAGTVSRKREIGFMGLVLGGRAGEAEAVGERQALLPAGKLFHGAEQKDSKVVTVQPESLLACWRFNCFIFHKV